MELVPTAGKEKEAMALDFPGVRFEDQNIVTKPERENQVVIENLRENTVKDRRPGENEVQEVAEVDWLGVPLAPSTLPDFVSMYSRDYPRHIGGSAHVEDPRKIMRRHTKGEWQLHQQFDGVGWVKRDTLPMGQEGGYVKMGGEVGRALLHPHRDLWTIPPSVVERIRRGDPMEYLNLCDPLNKKPVERAIYQWTVHDLAAIDERATVGPSARTSGYTANSSPHLPPPEERDFKSVYWKSYDECIARDDIEGLHPSLIGTNKPESLQYPGYSGTAVMDDNAFAFLRENPHVLRTKTDMLKKSKSHHLIQRHREFTNS